MEATLFLALTSLSIAAAWEVLALPDLSMERRGEEEEDGMALEIAATTEPELELEPAAAAEADAGMGGEGTSLLEVGGVSCSLVFRIAAWQNKTKQNKKRVFE